jgi:hypothetical protein
MENDKWKMAIEKGRSEESHSKTMGRRFAETKPVLPYD